MNKASLKIPQTIRPELNLTKYSDFIFPHPQTKELGELRRTSWLAVDGSNCEILISTNKDFSKPLTSKSYKVLLAIFIHIQLNKLDPFKEVKISLKGIADILGKSWNGRVAEELCSELGALSSANIRWVQSFKHKGGKTSADINDFHIINDVGYKAKEISAGEYFKGVKSISLFLNRKLAKNIKNNYCIPINFKVYQDLNNKPYIQILYLKIGLYLSSNKYREQQLSALKIFEILHIESDRYFGRRGKENRKAFLDDIVQLLSNQPLSNNYTLNIDIAETVDKSDYKLIIKTNRVETKPKHQLVLVNKDEQLVLKLCHDIRIVLNIDYKALTKEDKDSIKHYCEVYPKNIIKLAITTFKERSTWKEQQGEPIVSKFAYFAACLHHRA